MPPMFNSIIQPCAWVVFSILGFLVSGSVWSSQDVARDVYPDPDKLWVLAQNATNEAGFESHLFESNVNDESAGALSSISAELPAGLSVELHECTSAINAISCDINVRSTLENAITLSLKGVYWKTKTGERKKTAILSKNVDKLSAEINVVSGADIYVSSLIIVHNSNQIEKNLSLGIHLSIDGVEYFVNTQRVKVLEITG